MKRMKTLIPLLVAALGFAAAARAGDVKAIYEKDCTKCHGADGKGETKMGKKLGAKDYTDAKVQAEIKDDAAFKAIKEGLKDRSEEHTSELQSRFGISYAVFCLKKKK